MTTLHVNIEQIVRNWQSLRGTWDNTREAWKDTDRDQFEREHFQEIAQATNSYIGSLRHLAEITQRILSEMP